MRIFCINRKSVRCFLLSVIEVISKHNINEWNSSNEKSNTENVDEFFAVTLFVNVNHASYRLIYQKYDELKDIEAACFRQVTHIERGFDQAVWLILLLFLAYLFLYLLSFRKLILLLQI